MNDELDDDQLEEELRQLAARWEPVPRELMLAAADVFGWRDIDTELADLVYDSLLDSDEAALVRGADDQRLFSFRAGDMTIDLEVTRTGPERSLLGQIIPPQACLVDLRQHRDIRRPGQVPVGAAPIRPAQPAAAPTGGHQPAHRHHRLGLDLTPGPAAGQAGTEVLLRSQGRSGEVVLRRTGTGLELIVNGVFLMDSGRDGQSERALARTTLAHCPTQDPSCLVGGLGFGYTVAQMLTLRPAARITCVELEPAVLACLPRVATACGHPPGLATDPRLHLVPGDVLGWARQTGERYHAIALDTDNGPSWLVRPENGRLYSGDGLAALARVLLPGGVLGVWSAQPEEAFARRLARHFGWVRAAQVPHHRGAPDVVYLAGGPRAWTVAKVP